MTGEQRPPSWASVLQGLLDDSTAQLGVHAGFLAVARVILANKGGHYTDAQLVQRLSQHLAQTDAELAELAQQRRDKRARGGGDE